MPDTWFTADFQFGHRDIIRYCNRPFRDVVEMDETIRERLNTSVKLNDTIYFLGDFCIGGMARALAYRKQIRCKRICGNGQSRQGNTQTDRGVFLAE